MDPLTKKVVPSGKSQFFDLSIHPTITCNYVSGRPTDPILGIFYQNKKNSVFSILFGVRALISWNHYFFFIISECVIRPLSTPTSTYSTQCIHFVILTSALHPLIWGEGCYREFKSQNPRKEFEKSRNSGKIIGKILKSQKKNRKIQEILLIKDIAVTWSIFLCENLVVLFYIDCPPKVRYLTSKGSCPKYV